MDGATDLIEVRGLRLRGHVGVTPEERAQPQDLVVSLAARIDTRLASATDDLAATFDYEEAVREISKIVSQERSALLETLADHIARVVLAHSGVLDVWVRIAKPHAPLPEPVDEVAVEVSRSRDDLAPPRHP